MSDFYVAEKNTLGEYVSSVAPGGVINYSSNLDDALWSTQELKVNQLISRNSIPNVSATLKSGNHPNKPPL